MDAWGSRILAAVAVLVVPFGLIFGIARVYALLVPRRPNCVRPSGLWLGFGVLLLSVAAFSAWLLHALLGSDDMRQVGFWAMSFVAFGGLGGLLVHFVSAARSYVASDRLVFRRWLRPRLEAPMAEIVGSELGHFFGRLYEVCLSDGRRVGILVTSDGIWTLHAALKAAGKTTPADKQLADAIAAEWVPD
jgi:hypothetical protein